jgi:hypothetical protein
MEEEISLQEQKERASTKQVAELKEKFATEALLKVLFAKKWRSASSRNCLIIPILL